MPSSSHRRQTVELLTNIFGKARLLPNCRRKGSTHQTRPTEGFNWTWQLKERLKLHRLATVATCWRRWLLGVAKMFGTVASPSQITISLVMLEATMFTAPSDGSTNLQTLSNIHIEIDRAIGTVSPAKTRSCLARPCSPPSCLDAVSSDLRI